MKESIPIKYKYSSNCPFVTNGFLCLLTGDDLCECEAKEIGDIKCLLIDWNSQEDNDD
jgi:hypothetical protein